MLEVQVLGLRGALAAHQKEVSGWEGRKRPQEIFHPEPQHPQRGGLQAQMYCSHVQLY